MKKFSLLSLTGLLLLAGCSNLDEKNCLPPEQYCMGYLQLNSHYPARVHLNGNCCFYPAGQPYLTGIDNPSGQPPRHRQRPRETKQVMNCLQSGLRGTLQLPTVPCSLLQKTKTGQKPTCSRYQSAGIIFCCSSKNGSLSLFQPC